MKHFQVIQPSNLLLPYIKQYWFLRIDDGKQSFQRSIPSGCVALVFHKGNNIFSSLHNGIQPHSYLSGQSIVYSDIMYSHLDMIIVVFQPIGCKAFFSYPINEFTGRNVCVDLLSDIALIELEQKINETSDNYKCIYLIEEYLLKKLCKTDFYNYQRMQTIISTINKGEWDITTLTQTACLGYKQFKRVFTEYTGLNPKDFLQITRFKKAFHLIQLNSQINISRLAYDCAYYDKSHLIKEFRTFTGYTPKELIAVCDIYVEYLSLFNSFFINGENSLNNKIL